MTNPIEQWTQQIHCGDAFDVLGRLPASSVHACVTDPPYGLAFMGRDWDSFDPKEYQEWCEEWAREVKRVLKPGGHLLAFSGNRTHHRLFTGVEDAGFEIRDTLTWHYGSGFPKAADISKTIDKREGAEREVVGEYTHPDGGPREWGSHDEEYETYGESDGYKRRETTEPATDAAREWDGWKTGLKPATEYIVMARKPFDGATVDCVLEHGTGALNIDGARVSAEDGFSWEVTGMPERTNRPSADVPDGNVMARRRNSKDDGETVKPEGRYPSNVLFDETAAEQLDREVGELETGELKGEYRGSRESDEIYGEFGFDSKNYESNSGGPSRYFYTSKASKAERTEGGSIENSHPTVKPQDLMEWLIKLVTRENQIVIDPFAGSGTTCKAAKELGREFVGIEKQTQWADVARVRCNLTPDDPSVVRSDESQSGLEAYTDGGQQN